MMRTLKENGFEIDVMTGLNAHRPHAPLSWLRYGIMLLIFGGDIRFLQYGFRSRLQK